MFYAYCKLVMRTVDESLARRVCRSWETMCETLEFWRCSGNCCDLHYSTVLDGGRRVMFGCCNFGGIK